MKYLKAMFAGVTVFVLATVLYTAIWIAIALRRYPTPPGTEVGFDLRSFFISSPSFWLVSLAAFALGFWWTFRR